MGWRVEPALVAGLVGLAAAVRWVDLWTLPIFTDEGDEIGLALRIVRDGGRLRSDLADRGGLVVLARRTVPAVSRGYQVEEIAEDAAPGAPPGTGFSIVRVRRAGG